MSQPSRRLASALGLLVFVGLAAGSLPDSTSSRSSSTPSTAAEPDNLTMASRAFVGEPPVSEVKRQLDRALTLYGDEPRTNENYGRAASALVALRKNTGVSEMRILDHMIRSHVPGVKLSFPDAAGLSASFLKAGDK